MAAVSYRLVQLTFKEKWICSSKPEKLNYTQNAVLEVRYRIAYAHIMSSIVKKKACLFAHLRENSLVGWGLKCYAACQSGFYIPVPYKLHASKLTGQLLDKEVNTCHVAITSVEYHYLNKVISIRQLRYKTCEAWRRWWKDVKLHFKHLIFPSRLQCIVTSRRRKTGKKGGSMLLPSG